MVLKTNTGLTAVRPGLHRNRQQSENQSTEEPPEGTHVGLWSDPVHSSDTQTGETLYSPDPPVIIHIQSVPVTVSVCRLAGCRCYFHTFGWKQIRFPDIRGHICFTRLSQWTFSPETLVCVPSVTKCQMWFVFKVNLCKLTWVTDVSYCMSLTWTQLF